MLPGEVKGDAAFTAFAAKLATVVANARSVGVKISNQMIAGCKCPLGCHPDSSSSHPPSYLASREAWTGVPVDGLRSFVGGYGFEKEDERPRLGPYFDLGRAYREMFP